MSTNFFHHHTRSEISEMAQKGYTAVVPLAATEQHGPHLPVHTDSIIGEHVVTNAVEQAADSVPILMTPVLTIGCSGHHLGFGGTLSFSTSTYLQMLRDIGESLISDGFRKIIFVNGHGGNANIMTQTANDLAVEHNVWTASASYWSISRASLQDVNASEVGSVPGHAGGFETALILALRPELVKTDHIRKEHTQREWINSGTAGAFIGKHGELTGYNGFTDSPSVATAEKGNLYLKTIVHDVTEWLISTHKMMEKGERNNE